MSKTLLGHFLCSFLLLLLVSPLAVSAQMITGTWKGKINKQRVEVKIIQQGDSLTGTSYYYESANNYRRYSIKGYFDGNTNAAVWWDDQLLEEKSGRFSISIPGKTPLLSRADFNCPGGGRMMLDGNASEKEDDTEIKGDVRLDKTNNPVFEDEWDFVIDNYTVGANDPYIIDSIANIALPPDAPVLVQSKPVPLEKTVAIVTPPINKETLEKPVPKPIPVIEKEEPIVVKAEPLKIPSIEEKLKTRQKAFIKEIPVSGDSIELRFYDNAEIDGDSISLFLNDKLIFSHIRLTGKAYSIKIPVTDLNEVNELVMVAENLGSIPPNTSYMVAIVNEIRYDATLSSTEGSSAMIRLLKKIPESK